MNAYQKRINERFNEELKSGNIEKAILLSTMFIEEAHASFNSDVVVWQSMANDIAKAQADELWKGIIDERTADYVLCRCSTLPEKPEPPTIEPRFKVNEVVYFPTHNELVKVRGYHHTYHIEMQNGNKLWVHGEHLKPASEAPESCR